MERQISKKRLIVLLALGMAGCVFMAASDWLMIYGDPTYSGALPWLTEGVAQMPPGRNALALALAFPAVVLYCFGLFAVRFFLSGERRKRYCALTALGLTPWLCIHLFYVMILYLFAWLHGRGEAELAFASCEALFAHFSWLIPAAEVLMVLPYLYLLILTAAGKTALPRVALLNNPLVLFGVLSVVKSLLPNTAWKLAFTNGLMSEAMFLWFLILILLIPRSHS